MNWIVKDSLKNVDSLTFYDTSKQQISPKVNPLDALTQTLIRTKHPKKLYIPVVEFINAKGYVDRSPVAEFPQYFWWLGTMVCPNLGPESARPEQMIIASIYPPDGESNE